MNNEPIQIKLELGLHNAAARRHAFIQRTRWMIL